MLCILQKFCEHKNLMHNAAFLHELYEDHLKKYLKNGQFRVLYAVFLWRLAALPPRTS